MGNQKTVVSPSETERPLPTADRPKHGSIRFSKGTEIDVEQRMREKSFVPNTPSVRSQAQNPLPVPKKHQKKNLDFQKDIEEKDLHFDIEVKEEDDFDH